jgi:hypothetical protein
MIYIGLLIVALAYIVSIWAVIHAPFPESHDLGYRAGSVRAGKLPAGSVSNVAEPATNLPGCDVVESHSGSLTAPSSLQRAVEAEADCGTEGEKPSTPTNL